MRIFNATFEVTKICRNGNEKRFKTNILINVRPHEDWRIALQRGVDYMEKVKGYINVEYFAAKYMEVVE